MYIRFGSRNTNLKFEKVKRTLERNKNRKYPKIPSNIQQLQKDFKTREILNEYGSTLDGDTKFYIDTVITPDYEFTIFASQFVMSFINDNITPGSRNYLMDGTFNSLPNGFYQLLIIAIEYENDVSSFSAFMNILTRANIMILHIHTKTARPPAFARLRLINKKIFTTGVSNSLLFDVS